MEKPLKVRLHIISPVHIGCDDVYEPTGFVIDEKRGRLIAFDPIQFIQSLLPQDRGTFATLCSQGNISSIVSILKFILGKQIQGREIEIARGLIPHYRRVVNLPINNEGKIKQELNQFAISRTAYNSYNNLPYIPGSSLKGALRTAYLSKIAGEKGIRGRKDRARALENELLGGSFDRDPFRMVKVSDLTPIGDVKTKIVYAVNRKKKKSKFEARGPFQIMESIKEATQFEGIINIQQPERICGITKSITVNELLRSINAFYIPLVNEENNVTSEIDVGSMVVNKINNNFKSRLGKTAFLLRIGRHSGAEAVTIEGNRNIKIMQGREQSPKFLDHSTTLWLASEESNPRNNNGLIPFGWAVLETVS